MVNETGGIEVFTADKWIIVADTDDIEITDEISFTDEIFNALKYVFGPLNDFIPIDFQFLQVIFDIFHAARLGYEENQLKKQLMTDIEELLSTFRSCEISSNSLLIKGSLVYCRKILKKYYDKDSREIDVVTTHISLYIKRITELELLMKNENLINLDLKKCIDEFNKIQKLSSDFGLFPRLDDDNLDLAILLDEKHEYKPSKMLSNPL